MFRKERHRTYDFTNFYPDHFDYEIPRLAGLWDYPEMENEVHAFDDFPGWGFQIPVFSSRAINVLVDLLEANGEILPIRTSRGDYSAYQTLTIADGVLDVANTKGNWTSACPGMFSDIGTYCFHGSGLDELSIFRVREHPSRVLVTSTFKDRVDGNGLNGFRMKQVWPVLSREERIRERKQQSKRSKIEINGRLKDYQAHTVVIHLPIDGDSPSAAEEEKIGAIRKQLNDDLVLDALDSPYFGSVAGYEQGDSTHRLLLTCPDADRLIDRIAPILRSLDWPSQIRISRRSRPIWWDGAKDKFVEI